MTTNDDWRELEDLAHKIDKLSRPRRFDSRVVDYFIQPTLESLMNKLVEARIEDLVPNTFIAVDVDNPEDGSDEGSTVRFVGTFVRWTADEPQSMIIQDPDNGGEIDILRYAIEKVWWAPMGYRP